MPGSVSPIENTLNSTSPLALQAWMQLQNKGYAGSGALGFRLRNHSDHVFICRYHVFP